MSKEIDDKAIREDLNATIVGSGGNYCPIVIRNAWHASGTFDKSDSTGGSNGATMRFQPELGDRANVGLDIVHKLLEPLKEKHPGVSIADLWNLAGVQAVKLAGGPNVPFSYGRTDIDASEAESKCTTMRLPPPVKDATTMRKIFYRMGLDDRGIVALSGAHTLGRCNKTRSGFDGPWTKDPLKFNNQYYKNLLEIEWTMREWDGPPQYTDPSGELMMLITDIELIKDPAFLVIVKEYAADEQLFFKDFADAFGKLLSLGCPVKH